MIAAIITAFQFLLGVWLISLGIHADWTLANMAGGALLGELALEAWAMRA